MRLSAEEKAQAEAQVVDGRLRVGIDKAVNVTVKLGPMGKFGDVAPESDRTVVWSGRVSAPGATAMRLHLAPFDLPEGSELYVYSADGQAFGPYLGRGPLDEGEIWTNTILGRIFRLQVRVAAEDLAQAHLSVVGVGYMGAGLPMAGSNLCAENASCVVNAGCVSVAAVGRRPRRRRAPAFASGGSYYICTGGLIADSDTSSTVPYFLTANHCISRSSEASSLETYFDYETTCNSPNCTAPYPWPSGTRNPDTLGATIVAGNRTNDFTLLRLSSAPPLTTASRSTSAGTRRRSRTRTARISIGSAIAGIPAGLFAARRRHG